MRIVSLAAAAAAAAILFANAASAAPIVDVDHLLLPPAGTNSWSGMGADTLFGFSVGQSWTVITTGKLSTIELIGSADGYMSGPFDVSLSVFRGFGGASEGAQLLGTLVRSSTTIAHDDITTFDFSSLDIDAIAGETLTWEMGVASCAEPCIRTWSNWTRYYPSGLVTGAYAGGSAYGYSPEIGLIPQFDDGNFRITMTPAEAGGPDPAPGGPGVPEPSAWALLVMGFGASGAALRRRSPRAPASS